MTADVSLSQLWFNPSLMNFFFRTQAQNTLEELVDRVNGRNDQNAFYELEELIDQNYSDLDDFEEECYNSSVDEILEALGYEYE